MPQIGLNPEEIFPVVTGPRRLEVRRAEGRVTRLFGDAAVDVIRFDAPATFSAGEEALDVLVVTGGAIDAVDASAVRCAKDHALVVSPRRSCRLITSASLEAVRYRVRGSLLARLRDHAPAEPCLLEPVKVVDLIARLASEVRRADAATALAIEGALCELVARAERLSNAPSSVSAEVAAAMHYVRLHIGERITVADIAGAAGVSPRVITSRFAADLSTSPLDYVRAARLAEAAVIVAAGTEPLAEIAHRLGFYDHAHFTKLFREAYGVPPSDYRRSLCTNDRC